ncbi:MAG: tyrosine-type recombinase/integrase [Arachnia sp.]
MHSISDPTHVRFTGPLARYASGLVEELSLLGYASTSATIQVQLAAHLSRWMTSEALMPQDLTGPVIERFLAARRASHTHNYSLQALAPVLGYLRLQGVVPAALVVQPSLPSEVALAQYRRWLRQERGVSVPVTQAYSHWVTPFVKHRTGVDGQLEFAGLSANDVARFVSASLPMMTRKTAQMTACALRSFLRFLHEQQMVEVGLADAIPAVLNRRLSGLPQALTPAQVDALLAVCDTSTPVGRRDYAVITVFHRLGLRCAEVAGLRLEDLDWQAGTLLIHGKGDRVDRLPLPIDVGEAMVEYLHHGRPRSTSRAVFIRARAPFTEMAPSSVSCIVGRAAQRAGLSTIHAHRLRHTTASRTLNAGASLEEVAHLLRHASASTTVIYAKTDQTRLAQLARPWPGVGGQ